MPASDGPPLDPRVPAQVKALTDAEVRQVLTLMAADWSPQEPWTPDNPATERRGLVETVRLNMGTGGEAEYEAFQQFIARAKAALAAPTQDGGPQ